jgi:putative aldouronate transport system substrate-binding protein
MKKSWAVVLCAVMLASALAGCTSGPASAPANGTATTVSSAPVDSAAVANQPTKTIKELLGYTDTDPNLEPPAKKIAEMTGYKLEFYTLPAENFDEKLNLEISTGTEYDLIMLSSSQFQTLMGKGALVDFGPIMDQYAPDLKASFNEDEWATGEYDGKTYGIPQFDARYVESNIAYRKDIADSLGLTAPTDPDGLYNFLKAVKAAKPDIIPLTGNETIHSTISSGFGITWNQWVVAGDTITHRVLTPEIRDYLAYMAKLYSEGLLDVEWPVNKGDNIDEKFTSGKAFSDLRAWYDAPTINPALEKTTGGTVAYIQPLKNPLTGKASYGLSIGPSSFVSIPTTCKDPTEVMKYLNLRAQPDIFVTSFLGVKDVQYQVKQGPGGDEYWPIFPAFTEWYNASYFFVCVPSKTFTTLWLCRVRKSEILYNVFTAMNAGSADEMVYDPLSYAPPLLSVAKYVQSLGQMENDFYVQVITGTKSISDFDAFVSDWKSQGGQEMLTEVQNWYANNK